MADLNDLSTNISIHDEDTEVSASIEKDVDLKGRLFVDAVVSKVIPTDQLILTVLGEIKMELKKLNAKINLTYELDKFDNTELE